MLRNTLIALGTLVLAACANPVRDAQETLTESLPVKTGVEFRAMQSYPGDVICGEYNAYESPTEAKQGFMPFITVRGALYKQPDKQQLAIYCSPDPAQQLLALAGVGPYDADNTTLPKITEDFAQLSGALERYVEDNYKYPTMEQGL